MKNNKLFLSIFLIFLFSAFCVNAASTCNEYCTGKGNTGGYCFNYDDSTKSESPGWVEHGANNGACSIDLTKCNYAIVAIGCHDLDDGSKNICGDCSAMHANIWCNCYKTMDCPTNCRSDCKNTGCRNSQEIPSDATCETSCASEDCRGTKCTGGSCTPTPGLGETWSGGVCYFGITYVKNVNCPGATGAAGYCSCWREQPCPDTSAEGLAGMAENKCDADQGCRTEEFLPTPTPTPTPSPTETGGSAEVINKIKAAVYNIVMTLYCLALYIASAVAALFLVLTGIKYMSSDEEGGRAESRKRMVYALAGLMIIALACPVVNVLFAGSKIGIPNPSTGVLEPCPGCPIIGKLSYTGGGLGAWTGGYSGGGGGGDKGTDWFSTEGMKQSESFQVCSTSQPTCPDGRVCASTDGAVYKCYPKVADGYSYEATTLTPLSRNDADLCMSGGIAGGGKCGRNTKCSAGCLSSEYCGQDAYCKPKLAIGEKCSASGITGANPDAMCTSNWCVGGDCVGPANCNGADDCNRHYSGRFCDSTYICKSKLSKGSECGSGLITGGTADDMCSTGTCDTSTNPDKCT